MPPPSPDTRFTLLVEATKRYVVHYQLAAVNVNPSAVKISLSLESFLGRIQLTHVDRSPSELHCFPKNNILRKYAETFTDVLLSAEI